MSKIALTPDPSGTGTFTIASPNSNTNRTLTLPDASGTLFSDADVASQASAEAGTGTGLMTSELTAQAIAAQVIQSVVINAATSAYTVTASDRGEVVSTTTGGFVLPAATFVDPGFIVTLYNNSDAPQSITAGASTTLRFAGSTLTGNRTLQGRGLASVICISLTEFVISGVGLT
jgi:hypothetical protein